MKEKYIEFNEESNDKYLTYSQREEIEEGLFMKDLLILFAVCLIGLILFVWSFIYIIRM